MSLHPNIYRALFEQNPSAVCSIDTNGIITGANASCELLTGYRTDEMIGKNFTHFFEQKSITEVTKTLAMVLLGNQIESERILVQKQGSLVNASIMCFPVYDNNQIVGTIAVATVSRDMSEMKKTEWILRQNEEKMHMIAENTSDIIYLLDVDTRVTYLSPSFTRILGYQVDELLFSNVLEGFGRSIIHSDDIEYLQNKQKESLSGKQPFQVEYRVRHKQGNWIFFESIVMPIIKDSGELEGAVVVARDVTERKRSEELLRISDKLSVLGELAAGIAHEIRNPLTSIRGFIQLFQSSQLDPENFYDIILSELDRINFIVGELLFLAKPQATQYRLADLNSLIFDVLLLLQPQATLKGIEIKLRVTESVYILCEKSHLKQVFINLIKNSIEASSQDGTILVKTVKLSNELIQIQCIDYGCGIPRELIPRLGEPFYTTKAKGTGLGLMVSNKIIKDHRGELHIESEMNKGTTITITLPIIDPIT